MKVGVTLPQFRATCEPMLAAARHAEVAGLDGIFVFDHLFPPQGGPSDPVLEGLATLGAVAAETRRVEVGTLVVRATLRPPAVVRSAFMSADRISSGRFIGGIGAGDSLGGAEFAVYGLEAPDFASRLRCLDALATSLAASDFPLWIGGLDESVRRLAAEHADAWNVWGVKMGNLAKMRANLHRDAVAAGRKDSLPVLTWGGQVAVGATGASAERRARKRKSRSGALESDILVGGPERAAEILASLADAGVSYAVLAPVGAEDGDELFECYETISKARDWAFGK